MFDLFDLSSRSSTAVTVDPDFCASTRHNGVHELMRAMILRTIEDFNSNDRLKARAVHYMTKTDDDDGYILSFQSICKHFGMDPSKTRNAIMNATRKLSTRRRTI